jgi:ribosomal protein S18 acetylase RimI-like enzyme
MQSTDYGGTAIELRIVQAGFDEIDSVARLFDQYRQFYGQDADAPGARAFIGERVRNLQSVILLALARHDEPIGFTQLYPSFSSVSMRQIWVLNDLFVVDAARRNGVAWALLDKAKEVSLQSEAKGLVLATAIDNHSAMALYESFGFIRDDEFHHYFLPT